MATTPNNRQPDPTPAEIAERAAEVRAGWKPWQRAMALGIVKLEPWTAPEYTVESPRFRGDVLKFKRIG